MSARSAPPFRTPRGIFYGWVVAGAVTMAAFSQVAFFNPVLGAFFSPLEEEFGWSRAAITGGLSAGTLLGALAAPFLGGLMDRYGGRWFLVCGIGTMAVCLALLAAIDSLWQFYALYVVGRALVTGVTIIALSVTIANWFIRDRGRASAMMLAGQRAGAAVMPLLVIVLIDLGSWRLAYLALAVIVAAVGVLPSWLLIRRRPEDFGLLPDGDAPEEPGHEDGGVTVRALEPNWSVRQAIATPAFWLLLIGTSQLTFVGGAVNLSLLPHMEDNGIDRATAGIVITAWSLAGIVGGVVGGELRKRLETRYALPLMMVLTAGGLAWFIVVQSAVGAFVFAAWHGLGFGAMLALNQVVYPDYFGRFTVGALRGITAPVQFGLNAVGPLAASYLFDVRGSYTLAFSIFVGCYLFGALATVLARPPQMRV